MSSSLSLTDGALLTLCQGGDAGKPLLQVLGLKKVPGKVGDRYRAFVSDGRYSNSFSMLATQMNDKVGEGKIETFAVIQVNKCICNELQGKKVIILLDVDVVKTGSEVGSKIGEPVQIQGDGSVAQGAKPTTKRPANTDNSHQAKKRPRAASEGKAGPDRRPSAAMASPLPLDPAKMNVFPIASLTPYQNRWTIRARVTHKSDIRRWSNSRGEGHLFSMDLLDESGEIRATAFKDQCDKYYNMIEVGKLYYITSCSLKATRKQYSNLNNEYEMTFRDSTEVVRCREESSAIPTLSFNFVKISELAHLEKGSLADVIGVVKTAGDAATITSGRTGKELTKRDITLVDSSLAEVGLTLWGTTAETFDAAGDNPVVAIKGARISDFNGVSLSSLSSSVVQINPDEPQTHTLKGWYDTGGSRAQTSSLTQPGRGGLAGGNFSAAGANMRSLADIRLETQGRDISRRPDFYSLSGYITRIQKERALYRACGREVDGRTCNKKVLEQNNGMYRCEKCNVEVGDFNWRLSLIFGVSDPTGNHWLNCFQEQGEAILGITSQELGALFAQDMDEYSKVFARATFKAYNFRISCKTDFYNDETRIRYTVRAASPLNPLENAKRMLRELEAAGGEVPENVDICVGR